MTKTKTCVGKHTNFNQLQTNMLDITSDLETPSSMETVITIDSNFENLSNKLHLSKDVRKKAWDYWLKIVDMASTDLKEVPKSDLLTCCFYQSIIDSRMPYGPTDPQLQCGYIGQPDVTVTDLLKSSDKTVKELFAAMHVLRDASSISDAVKYHLTQLERKFCIVSAIFHTFERVCKAVFREDDLGQNKELSVPDTNSRKTLCWLLFLLTKGSLMTDDQLVDAFLLLICCVEYVIMSTPAFQLISPLDNIKINSTENTESDENIILWKLSEMFQLSFEEVQAVKVHRTDIYFKTLPHTDGELNITLLKEKYEKAYRQDGDIDEMLFLARDPHVLSQEHDRVEKSLNNNEAPMTPVRHLVDQLSSLSLSIVDNDVR